MSIRNFSWHISSGIFKCGLKHSNPMKGLKKYSHKDRGKVIKEMVPLIKKKFGKNLVALAAQASYARYEDFDYSDLELIAFVEKMPKNKKWGGMGKIRDGLLVELVWTTKENYLKERDVTKDWYIAGSDVLLPLINDKFINDLKKYKVENLKKKCLNRAADRWHEAQESTAKVLNAINKKNKEGMPLLAIDMFFRMLVVLSFLNQIPYVTHSKFVSQAKKFKIKPKSFNELIEIMVHGKYQDLARLKKVATKVFSEFEKIFENLGFDLYYDNVDPNKPMKKFVYEP